MVIGDKYSWQMLYLGKKPHCILSYVLTCGYYMKVCENVGFRWRHTSEIYVKEGMEDLAMDLMYI